MKTELDIGNGLSCTMSDSFMLQLIIEWLLCPINACPHLMSFEQNTFPSGSVPSLNPIIASLELKAYEEPQPSPKHPGETEIQRDWTTWDNIPKVQAKLEEAVVKAASQHDIAIGLLWKKTIWLVSFSDVTAAESTRPQLHRLGARQCALLAPRHTQTLST